jgi:hypothetical protein
VTGKNIDFSYFFNSISKVRIYAFMHENLVGSKAGLSRHSEFCPQDPCCCQLKIGILSDDD